VLSSPTDIQDIVRIAPEWQAHILGSLSQGKVRLPDVFNQIGAKEVFAKALSLDAERARFVTILRDGYYQPLLNKMLNANVNLRRFWGQRRVAPDEQRQQAVSFSVDLAQKMEGVLNKQLNARAEDGFKVLLPAYIQRAVHNAVVDYIRQEWGWERQTLQDLNLDPDGEDPRQNVADDVRYAPESQALSNEKVAQLNELRQRLTRMLADSSYPTEPLTVIDCMFGLGLTELSKPGEEMTMREVCDLLKLPGDTPARRIARCQVLLDKGMDIIRQDVRQNLKGLAESWQGSLNVNSASRRELSQQLGLTEGEVDRLVAGRQFREIKELVERAVLKAHRLPEIVEKGGVAAFVPVDLNGATVRDMVDILGLAKELAQKIASERPFSELPDLVARKIVDRAELDRLTARGAALKIKTADTRRIDLNGVEIEEVVAAGVPDGIATLIKKGRPFLTWSELEDFLGCDGPTWAILRQKFCLGLAPG